MPEATAQLQTPEKIQIKDIDADRQSTVTNINQQVNNLNGTPNGTYDARSAFDKPVQVPLTGATVRTDSGEGIKLPPSHRSSKFFDDLEHVTPSLNNESAKPRVSEGSELNMAKLGQIDAVQREKNNPTQPSRGIWQSFNGWLHDEDKKAA